MGSIRLKQLDPWIRTWDDIALNAGVPGKSASDAWHATALDLEYAQLHGLAVAGGSLDIFKCFDQLNRDLILDLAAQAGMPQPVLQGYRSFVRNMRSRFQFGQDIGVAMANKTCIPQGCPKSMMMVALLMRPWIFYMRSKGTMPRCLPDDLVVPV